MKRDLALYLFGIVTGVSVLTVLGTRPDPVQDVVRARSFELVDSTGRQVGYWNTGWQGTRFQMWGSDSLASASVIAFKQGSLVEPHAHVILRRPNGANATLTTGDGLAGPYVSLYGHDGPRASLSAGYNRWGHGQLTIFNAPRGTVLYQVPER